MEDVVLPVDLAELGHDLAHHLRQLLYGRRTLGSPSVTITFDIDSFMGRSASVIASASESDTSPDSSMPSTRAGHLPQLLVHRRDLRLDLRHRHT